MKYKSIWLYPVAIVLLTVLLFAGGCTDINPIDQTSPSSPSPTPKPPSQVVTPAEVKVIYKYGDTGPVQLTNANVTLKPGQKLILEPAAGLTKNTRFRSSGDTYIGDIVKQEQEGKDAGRVVFTALKAGKGKLQIIPNSTEENRAADLWITVQQ
ncbi:hypothetical protein [Propionispora vibrioides]|uniref:Lipoprotein n=1 Tax=Propionispora vibrioides TaxID=112903 RepID=A0A1H8W5V8_9FIRM|nr:hypothetical protein [Propionispora vibrioides]SEP22807.1 hypothetical protein SAMN04490178_11442 [Propionispora vibrioides]